VRFGPGEAVDERTIPIVEVLGGKAFALEVRDWLPSGPRARCGLCGSLYSTSPYAPAHPCLDVQAAPSSPWDPTARGRTLERHVRELEHGRPRHARARPRTPSALVSAPVDESVCRRRCFVCRKVIGEQLAAKVAIEVVVRGQRQWFFRHPWCRRRAR